MIEYNFLKLVIIFKISNIIPMGHRDFKPVESKNFLDNEAGSSRL
jgi:hypothetical protein